MALVNQLTYLLRRKRRERQNVTAFAALIDTPGDLAAGVVFPANGVMYVSCSQELTDTTVLLEIKEVEYGAPALPADEAYNVAFVEKDVTVTKAAGAPGVVSIFIRDGVGALFKIGEA